MFYYAQASNYYRVFYLRRVCRIFPIYYLNLLVFLVLLAWAGRSLSPWLFENPLPLWSYLTFTQNFAGAYAITYLGVPALWLGVTWSLAVEEQFYLVMPWVVRHVQPHRLYWLMLGVIGVVVGARTFVSFGFTSKIVANYTLALGRFDGLMLGVLLAYLWRQPNRRDWLNTHRRGFRLVFGILTVGLVALNVGWQEYATGDNIVMATVGFTWMACFYAMLILFVLRGQRQRATAFFRTPVMRWLGEISYCVYLIHLPVLGLYFALLRKTNPRITGGRDLLVSVLALALSLTLATISWRWFERPIVRWGHSFHYQAPPATGD
jgi:peptidoglycan/LPS O-acetylase OafA/YrhL